ncbi:MAG: S8 family serine peptidase [Bryobacteraceae bacterium]|nr:S8 family serine peptidase [Bryobacteraceae bacterium]
MKSWLGLVLWVGLATAQVVPDRYIVELSEAPLGAEVRLKGKAALGDRQRLILTEQAQARSAVQALRGKVTSSVDSLMNALFVRLPAGQDPAQLEQLPGVKHVYPVRLFRKSLDRALNLHQVPAAWSLIGGRDRAGAGIKIAIIDTGISPEHPGFQDPALRFPPGFPRASSDQNLKLTNTKIIVARSYEDIYELDEPDDARDREGHGTSVAMCAAGVPNRGPLASITGVAPKAWIGGYKITPLNSDSAAEDAILKALDDALSDGMDVINLSFGSLFPFPTGPDLLPGVAFERLKSFGVMVVVAAGNAGPGLNSLSDFAQQPSVISVGAIRNDRFFGDSITVAGQTYLAFAGTGPRPTSAVTGPVADVETLDPTSFLCSPAAAGSLTGRVALILRGVCTFEEKANNAKAGGAVAALIYTDAARPDGFTPSVGTATLPTVLVSYASGAAIKAAVKAGPVTASLPFQQAAFTQDYRRLASFSSKGPTTDFRIKPDLTATGDDLYSATQKVDPEGEGYSEDGYSIIGGTSFASPIVAGAAAVLRSARPGLTVDQYNSLLINGATPLMVNGGQFIERVQQTGTGVLNLETALRNTVSILPTSLTFDVGNGSISGARSGHYGQIAITNLGRVADTFRIRSVPYDSAPALTFSATPGSFTTEPNFTLPLAPGQTKTVYAYWSSPTPLPRGEYQGQVVVEGTNSAALMPYWYAAPTLIPAQVLEINQAPARARPGALINLYLRVTDLVGYPLTTDGQLRFTGTASAGATIDLAPGVVFPNLRLVRLRLANTARANVFQLTFGGLAPISYTITGATTP